MLSQFVDIISDLVNIFLRLKKNYSNMSEKKEESEKKDKTNDVDDHISKRYEMKKRLGKGVSFILVVKTFT